MTILDELAFEAKRRVEQANNKEEMKQQALSMEKGNFAFERALKKPGLSFICECKKASPSKGLIAQDFPYVQIAKDYEMAGADCISVLTEPKWFLGESTYLQEISQNVSLPCLRKDFVVDPFMIYEAKVLGASAVLLICSILSQDELQQFIALCDQLGLSALVEVHDEKEIQMALQAGARLIGVNNRNLKDFSVDTNNSAKLRQLIPSEVLFVAESGIKKAEDVAYLQEIGADGVLIGESLMKAENKKMKIDELKSLLKEPKSESTSHQKANLITPFMAKVKLCGLSCIEDIQIVNRLKPEYIGFVFAPKSKRRIDRQQAQKLRASLDPSIAVVGVFVDEKIEEIASLLEENVIDIAQLHGKEDPNYLQALRQLTKKPLWKAIQIQERQDIQKANESLADLILLDAGMGSGTSFDWSFLKEVNRPYFLAGGLDTINIHEALSLHPYGVDVSSGIETNGRKDALKMEAFIAATRGENNE